MKETLPLLAAEVTEARERLYDAIEQNEPLAVIVHRYVALVIARVGTKVHAASRLGIDRRTIQRWEKRAAGGDSGIYLRAARGAARVVR